MQARMLTMFFFMLAAACVEPKSGSDRLRVDAGNTVTDAGGSDGTVQPDASTDLDGTFPDAISMDGTTADADNSDASDMDAQPQDAVIYSPSGFGVSSGGGTGSSTGYRVRLTTGSPAPLGTGSSTNYRVRVGTGSNQP